MTAHLSALDLAILAAYFGGVLWVGFRSRRADAGTVDFLVAGRTLTVPIFVMTLVSTWYGGILGVGEFTWQHGLSSWVMQGLPYYLFALIFALLLAGRIRETNLLTIPDRLEQAYGRRTALLGAVLTFILTTPAPYILMLGLLIRIVTGWDLILCLVLGTLAAGAYLIRGGFRADVRTDVLEFVLMFLGFGVMVPFALSQVGGWDGLRAALPPAHLTWTGGNPPQFIAVWFFIALWTLVDPAFHQRCFAAASPAVARRGILLSIPFWFLFDMLTATSGLIARALLPRLEQPVMAYPLLAEVALPPGVKGLFYAGMLATIMSTLNSMMLISAASLGRDVVWRLRGDVDNPGAAQTTKKALVMTGALSIILALFIPSVIRQWYAIGTVVVPGLLVPLLASYFPSTRMRAGPAFAAMLGGWLTSLAWLATGWIQGSPEAPSYPLGVEPMFPGLLVALLVWVPGRRGWSGVSSGGALPPDLVEGDGRG
jgi:SSS family solute:Na+ symporter